jgi:hypothetical protein
MNQSMFVQLLDSLKKNIKEHYTNFSNDMKNYIKGEVLACVGDYMPSVRKTVGTIIITIFLKDSVQSWPAMISFFFLKAQMKVNIKQLPMKVAYSIVASLDSLCNPGTPLLY